MPALESVGTARVTIYQSTDIANATIVTEAIRLLFRTGGRSCY